MEDKDAEYREVLGIRRPPQPHTSSVLPPTKTAFSETKCKKGILALPLPDKHIFQVWRFVSLRYTLQPGLPAAA